MRTHQDHPNGQLCSGAELQNEREFLPALRDLQHRKLSHRFQSGE